MPADRNARGLFAIARSYRRLTSASGMKWPPRAARLRTREMDRSGVHPNKDQVDLVSPSFSRIDEVQVTLPGQGGFDCETDS